MRTTVTLGALGLVLVGLGACTPALVLPREAFNDNGTCFSHSFSNATLEVAGHYRVEQCRLVEADVSPVATKKEEGTVTRVVLTKGPAPFRIQEVSENGVRRQAKEEDYKWVEPLLTTIIPAFTMLFFTHGDGVEIKAAPVPKPEPVLVR